VEEKAHRTELSKNKKNPLLSQRLQEKNKLVVILESID